MIVAWQAYFYAVDGNTVPSTSVRVKRQQCSDVIFQAWNLRCSKAQVTTMLDQMKYTHSNLQNPQNFLFGNFRCLVDDECIKCVVFI